MKSIIKLLTICTLFISCKEIVLSNLENSSYEFFNPNSQLIGRTLGPANGGFRASSHAIKGNIAYVSTWPSYPSPGEGLLIFDISNPGNPIEIGSYTEHTGYHDVLIEGNIAYLIRPTSLIVLDISDPTNVTKITSLVIPSYSVRVVKHGNKLSIGRSNGFEIIDISNPISPTIAGSLTSANVSYSTRFKDSNTLYVAETGNGVVAYDISNPLVITEINTIASTDPSLDAYEYRSIDLYNNTLAFNDGTSGIKIFDISNSNTPIYKSVISNSNGDRTPPYIHQQGLFVGGQNGLDRSIDMYDIGSLTSPVIFKQITFDDPDAIVNAGDEFSKISINGDIIYGSNGSDSFTMTKFK